MSAEGMTALSPPRSRTMSRIATGARTLWRGIIVDPIRRGRLRDTDSPRGLGPIVVVGVVAFCLAVALILGAPLVRSISPLTVSVGSIVLSLPRLLLPTIFWLVILSLALMQTAALHTRRRTTVVLTIMTSLVLLFIGSLDLGADGAGGVSITPGKIVSMLAVVGIILLVVLRRRSVFAWWEFPLVLAITGLSTVVSLGRSAAQAAPFGLDFGPTTASLVMSSLGQLAVPAALAAGVAVAEFAIGASTTAVAAVHRPLENARRRGVLRSVSLVLIIAFVLVALWRVIELALGLATGSGVVVEVRDLPLSIGIVLAIAGLWWGIARARRSSATRIDDVMSRLDDAGLPVAAALSITLAPVVVLLLAAQVVTAWGADGAAVGVVFVIADALRGTVALTIVRGAVGIALIVIAFVLARRGARGLPELLAAIGLFALLSVLPALVSAPLTWSSPALAVVIALGTLTLAVVLAVRRRLDARRIALLTVALLLSAAAAWRDVLADPLSAVIGASGIALVLFGFVWGFVTDADITHGESAAYPRPARVMLFLANAVFGVTVLAFGTLARDLGAAIDLDAFAQFGDELLGTALILAAVMAVWATATARDSADSRPEAPTVAA
ncbi:hypothetical protein [Microcella humidisoli]|uniref:Uncharacterized protein n=1 Tax=Microcella humidisoli TaxID=2963406 RepID=A0ABY5FUS2_9MICO|nr:hypothetical protein [Microcella humidisoli]UTT61993.1 hypothetical protein NNL39_09980 [Microcella humidisoli]